jgi:hypothetical protein
MIASSGCTNSTVVIQPSEQGSVMNLALASNLLAEVDPPGPAGRRGGRVTSTSPSCTSPTTVR